MNIIYGTNRLIIRKYSESNTGLLHKIFSEQITINFWPDHSSFEQNRHGR